MRVLSADWVLPVDGPPVERGAVALEDGRIAAVGTVGELGEGERFPGCAIVPGFVNAHAHLEYSLYAGFGDGLAFGPWIALHTERKRRLEWDDFLALARLGAAECLASGVTTVADASFSGAAVAACREVGLRAIVYLETFGTTSESVLEWLEATRARVADAFGDLVAPGVSPHAPYTVSVDGYAACRALGLPIATHLAETASENDYLLRGEGPMSVYRDYLVEPPGETGIRLLARHGLLGPDVVAAHCVKADAEEIALLARHDVGVVHCPRSNALLGCGTAPLAELLAAGIRVGLGTDSPASTPSFDMFDELRAAVSFARARAEAPDALTAAQALELATLGSARALGLDGEVGSLAPGKRADLTVVSLEDSAYVPWEDPAAAVVYGGSPPRVAATFVEGQLRYERGRFEWRDIRNHARRARSRMLLGAGAAPGPTAR